MTSVRADRVLGAVSENTRAVYQSGPSCPEIEELQLSAESEATDGSKHGCQIRLQAHREIVDRKTTRTVEMMNINDTVEAVKILQDMRVFPTN